MKSVLLITDVNFWMPGAGHRTKISGLVTFLARRTHLSVIYTLPRLKDDDRKRIEQMFSVRFMFLSEEKNAPLHQLGRNLQGFLAMNKIDCCIIEYIHIAVFLKFMDTNIKKILDIHDIVSDRADSFKQFNYEIYSMSQENEMNALNLFDHVMTICKPDYERLKVFIPEEKIINVPHAPKVHPSRVKESVTIIGFIGSAYIPNTDGVRHFMRECWPTIVDKFPFLHLNIYGYVGNTLNIHEVFQYKNIHIKGCVIDIHRIYDEIDIAINPVRFGAGLKIKNIEAMAHCKPLITTSHGARGLESGKNKAYMVADNTDDFVSTTENLVSNFYYRRQICENALAYIIENFNAEKCYNPLLEIINQ